MGKIMIDAELCKGCKLCLAACPRKLIRIGEKNNSMGYYYAEQAQAEQCNGCALCAVMCPDSAISVYK